MKRQLRIEYKDGSKVKITNGKETNMSFFAKYFGKLSIGSIQNAAIYTYPLKDNEPFILVEDGVGFANNISMLLGDQIMDL